MGVAQFYGEVGMWYMNAWSWLKHKVSDHSYFQGGLAPDIEITGSSEEIPWDLSRDGRRAGGVPEERAEKGHRGPRGGPGCLPVLRKEHQVEAPSPLPPITPSPQPLTSAAKQSTSLPPT